MALWMPWGSRGPGGTGPGRPGGCRPAAGPLPCRRRSGDRAANSCCRVRRSHTTAMTLMVAAYDGSLRTWPWRRRHPARPRPEFDPRRGHGQRDSARGFYREILTPARRLQREDVRAESSRDLLGQGIIARRQQTAVQAPRKIVDPPEVEMVEDSRIDASPVVNRHDSLPRRSDSITAHGGL